MKESVESQIGRHIHIYGLEFVRRLNLWILGFRNVENA